MKKHNEGLGHTAAAAPAWARLMGWTQGGQTCHRAVWREEATVLGWKAGWAEVGSQGEQDERKEPVLHSPPTAAHSTQKSSRTQPRSTRSPQGQVAVMMQGTSLMGWLFHRTGTRMSLVMGSWPPCILLLAKLQVTPKEALPAIT